MASTAWRFLLKRHGLSDVLGNAYVFPGGKVDGRDASLANRLDQPLAALHVALGETELTEAQAAGLYVAAIREVFEEARVLFAGLDGARVRAAWTSMRQGRRFDEAVSVLDVPLATAGLAPWARWITPVVSVRMRKRQRPPRALGRGRDAIHSTLMPTSLATLPHFVDVVLTRAASS